MGVLYLYLKIFYRDCYLKFIAQILIIFDDFQNFSFYFKKSDILS